MEAVFIAMMALVVLGSGYVALVVLYKLFKTDS
jgi:saccharopine dehydrogenase-like NADP-dependent oxidoreductase